MNTTAQNFQINEVSADKGYGSLSNYAAIKDHGAVPYIAHMNEISTQPFGATGNSLEVSLVTDRPPGFFEGTGMPDPGWWEALWPDPAKVLRDVGVTPGMDVIDLCCGDGWFTFPLATIARSIVAIDIDAALLEAAKVRIAERGGAPNCTFVEADAYDISSVVRGPIDYVFLANAFHGVPDRPRLSRAVHEILKPGGLFGIVSWHARPREETPVLGEPRGPATEQRMTPEQTVAGVEPSSLKFRNRVEVSPHHYAAVFERLG